MLSGFGRVLWNRFSGNETFNAKSDLTAKHKKNCVKIRFQNADWN